MESKNIKHGLRENLKPFVILVVVNAFVGAMIGLERSVFPTFAEKTFGIESKTAILSFIAAFGISKAIANYFTGKLANYFGRKNLLIVGWFFALPIAPMLIYAPSWNWVIASNLLLGLSQGLTWSSTVVMKIDLVGEKNRGLAMGLNEFAGYFAVGLTAFITGYIADKYGVSPYPFYLGVSISIVGLLLSVFAVSDTRKFVLKESVSNSTQKLKNVFIETTLLNKSLSSITQAGLVNNLNDGMIWGLLPMLLLQYGYSGKSIGLIAAIYPTVWGISQLFTGKLSDNFSKKKMLFWGMFWQSISIFMLPYFSNIVALGFISALLGIGTAIVYPTFMVAIAQVTHPSQRAESIGIFRLWRDSGYVFGAIISGMLADFFGITMAILTIGLLTLLSSFLLRFRMSDQL